MYLTAWLIGDDAEDHMKALTAPKDQPPAEKWLPLEAHRESKGGDLDEFRSAYAFRTGPGEQRWVDFAVPPEAVANALGPQALAPPRTLALSSAPCTALEKRAGIWMAKVPRFFDTFTSAWTYEMVGRDPLITRGGAQTNRTTVSELAIKESFRLYGGEPTLLVTSAGPRLHAWRKHGYYNVGGLTLTEDVMDEIAGLPGDTTVSCIWCEF